MDEVVTTIMQETAAEIAERLPIEMETIGTDKNPIHLLCRCASESGSMPDCADIQEHHGAGDLRRKFAVKRVLWSEEIWTDGYYMPMVGEQANWQTVGRHVQRQKQLQEDLLQLRMF